MKVSKTVRMMRERGKRNLPSPHARTRTSISEPALPTSTSRCSSPRSRRLRAAMWLDNASSCDTSSELYGRNKLLHEVNPPMRTIHAPIIKPNKDAKAIARREDEDCAADVGRGGKISFGGQTCIEREVLCAGTAYDGYPESNSNEIRGSEARDKREMSGSLRGR